jgi:hypothetical protein
MRRALLACTLAGAALWTAAAVLLCENALRLPPSLRPEARAELGSQTAAETNSQWQAVEVRARDGARLKAWWFEPPHATGTVLLFHGVADSRRGMMGSARILLRHGYRVLAADSRAHGESGGAMLTHGLREVDDVRRWVSWVQARHPVEPVYGLGASMGAAILLQAAAHGVPFRAIVAESPFADFPSVARYRVGQKAGPLGAPLAESALLYAKWRYGLDFRNASPADGIVSLRLPILLIHSPADTNIPVDHSLRLATLNRASVSLWAPPDVPHTATLARLPQQFERRVVAHFRAAGP